MPYKIIPRYGIGASNAQWYDHSGTAGNNTRFFMKHTWYHTSNKMKFIHYYDKRPSVTSLNCRTLTSFDGQMKYALGIRTINTVATIHSIHGILTVTAS